MPNLMTENPVARGSTDEPEATVIATCDYGRQDAKGRHRRCGNEISDGNGVYVIFDDVYICDEHVDDYLIEHEYIEVVS